MLNDVLYNLKFLHYHPFNHYNTFNNYNLFIYFCIMIDLPVVPVSQPQRKPDWLRVKLPVGKEYAHVRSLVDTNK